MTSPGASRSTGKVSVTVVPDTSKFHKELKAYLEKLEKQLVVMVDVEFDDVQAKAEFEKLKKSLSGDSVELDVKMNQRGLARSIASNRRATARLGAPITAIANQFYRVARTVNRITDRIITIRKNLGFVVSQTGNFAGRMVRATLSIENAKRSWLGLQRLITGTVNFARRIPDLAAMSRNLARAAAASAQLRLTEIVRAMFRLSTYTNAARRGMEGVGNAASSTVRSLSRIRDLRLSDLVGVFSRIRSGLAGIGRGALAAGRSISRGLGRGTDGVIRTLGRSVSKAFSSTGRMLSKVGSAFTSFGETLFSMSRMGLIVLAVVALLAPALGLLVAALAALPALIAVLGAGIGVVMLGMDGINKAAEKIKKPFEALQKAVSATFEKELAPLFKTLGSVIMPGLTKSLQGVAKGLVDMGKGLFDVIASKDGMAQMKSILDNIGRFFSEMRPFVREFVATFMTLAQVGTAGLSGTAASLANWAKQFRLVIDAAKETGVLQAALKGLGQVMSSLGILFNTVFDVGLKAMAELAEPLSNFIRSFSGLFRALMPILTTVSDLLLNVLGEAMKAIAPVLEELGPPLKELGKVLGELIGGALKAFAPLLLALATVIGGVLMSVLTALKPVIPIITGFLQKLGEVVGRFLTKAFQTLQPFLDKVLQFASNFLVALEPLLPVILELAETVLMSLVDILAQLMPILLDAAETIFPLLIDAAKELVPVIVDIIKAITPILPAIVELVLIIIEALIPVFEEIMDVVKAVFPYLVPIIKGALQFIQWLIETIMKAIDGDWEGAWEDIKEAVKPILEEIGKAIEKGFDWCVEKAKEFGRKIVDKIKGIGRDMYNAGVKMINDFVNGMIASFSPAFGLVQGQMNKLRGLFPSSPAKWGPFSGHGYTTYSGRALAEDWARGIEDGTPAAIRAVENLMDTSHGTATTEWRGLMQADGFGSVGDKIQEAMSGWTFEFDRSGFVTMVNQENARKARRR